MTETIYDILFPDEGKVYEPNYIRRRADLKYGEPVTHELFNEYMNVNIIQGDYNTEVLHLWNTNPNPTEVPHILYLDEGIQHVYEKHQDLANSIDDRFDAFDKRLDEDEEQIEENKDNIDTNRINIDNHYKELTKRINDIIDGTTIVEHANVADHLSSIVNADPYQYYGTNKAGEEGYWDIPPAIYARNLDSSWVSPSGTIIVEPSKGSVTRVMLNDELKALIDSITRNYNDLDNKPYINNVKLEGRKTLSELGIQPAGNYLTEIPGNYPTGDDLDEILAQYLKRTDAAKTYATLSAFNNLVSIVNDDRATAANTYARVGINGFPPNPKNGDLAVYV